GAAHLFEAGVFLGAQPQIRRGEVVRELLVGPRADDHRAHARAAEQPGQGDLGRRDAVPVGYLDEYLDRVVEPVLVVDGRLAPIAGMACALWRVLAPSVLAGQQTT